jgi:hypothetical protein
LDNLIPTQPIGGLVSKDARSLLKQHDLTLADSAFQILHTRLDGNASSW